jgi:hypothetical protein
MDEIAIRPGDPKLNGCNFPDQDCAGNSETSVFSDNQDHRQLYCAHPTDIQFDETREQDIARYRHSLPKEQL